MITVGGNPILSAPNGERLERAFEGLDFMVSIDPYLNETTRHADVILVVGSANSSNSNRLREIGAESGRPAYLIDDASDLQAEWFRDVRTVGLTAGASAPEILVRGVIEGLRQFGEIELSTLDGTAEDVRFRFPAELANT